jgi:hypothetical protein
MPILSSLAVACARAYGFTSLTAGGFVTVIQSFTATGEWVCPTGVTGVEWLIVAGGGGGGGTSETGAGGHSTQQLHRQGNNGGAGVALDAQTVAVAGVEPRCKRVVELRVVLAVMATQVLFLV